MVAAVAPASPPVLTSPTVKEPQLEKKKETNGAPNYGGLPPAEKANAAAVRKTRNREITSRYKVASPAPPSAAAGGRRNPSPLRQPSPSSSRQASPVRNRSSSSNPVSAATPDAHSRHPSPNLVRTSSLPDVPKRAYSAERRRPWPAANSSDSKSASTSVSTDGLGASKARSQSRGPELWPSMSASKQATEANGNSPNSRSQGEGRDQQEAREASDHTLKPAGNGVHRHAGNGDAVTVSPTQRKGSPMRRQSVDQAENARPTENSNPKPDHQRWPGMSTGKVFGGSMTRSMDLGGDRERPLSRSTTMVVQGRPGTPSSRMRSTVSRSFNRSVNEGPATPSGPTALRRNPSPTRGKVGTENGSRESVGNSKVETSPANKSSPGGGDVAAHVRRHSQESVAAIDVLSAPPAPTDTMSDTDSVSSSGSAPGGRSSVRGTTVPARVWQDMNNRLRRFSEGDHMRSSDSDVCPPGIAPVKVVRRSKVLPHQSAASMLMNSSMNHSMNGSMTSSWALSPGRGGGNSSPTPHPPSSPKLSKPSSPLRGAPSPQRSRPGYAASVAMMGTARVLGGSVSNFGIDGRSRGKKSLTQQEEAQLLRILHNRWLQWRFVNARAEAVMSAQKAAAEVHTIPAALAVSFLHFCLCNMIELELVFIFESLNIRSAHVILHSKKSCNEIEVGRVFSCKLQHMPH